MMLQTWGMWTALILGTDDYVEDQMTFEVISEAVPMELMGMMTTKPTANIVGDAIKMMNISMEHVVKAKVSTVHNEYDALRSHKGRQWMTSTSALTQ